MRFQPNRKFKVGFNSKKKVKNSKKSSALGKCFFKVNLSMYLPILIACSRRPDS